MTGAVYLYCLARAGAMPAIEETGVDGEGPVLRRDFSSLTAVLSDVQLDEFCGPEAESRLQDIVWVGPRAFRHEAVVETAMRHSPVFPLPFGTIFSSLEKLEEFLGIHQDTISGFLEQIDGRHEWAVKGLLDKTRAAESFFTAVLAEAFPDHDSLSPGRRYLAEKRLRGRAEKALQACLETFCKDLADDLCSQTADFRQRRVLSREASGMATEMIVNWAFLLPPSRMAEIQARIDRANADGQVPGLHFHLTGPWPPYSFRPSLSREQEA